MRRDIGRKDEMPFVRFTTDKWSLSENILQSYNQLLLKFGNFIPQIPNEPRDQEI